MIADAPVGAPERRDHVGFFGLAEFHLGEIVWQFTCGRGSVRTLNGCRILDTGSVISVISVISVSSVSCVSSVSLSVASSATASIGVLRTSSPTFRAKTNFMTRTFMKFAVAPLIILLFATSLQAQDRLPIIDVHLHALAADAQGPPPLAMCTPFVDMPTWDGPGPYGATFMMFMKNPPCDDPVWSPETDEEVMEQSLEILERRNIIAVVSGSLERVATWRAGAPDRLIPGLSFNVVRDAGVTPDSIRSLVDAGALEVFGEVTNQYSGISPNDERMEPYWALAEELQIPVGIHIGPGPPGVIYLGSSDYRARMHSALTMEEVLVRHPRLRVYIMHAGYPMLDDLLAVLYAHPQVYLDVGVIVYSVPRPAFYRYLQGIVDAGFVKRVMFGSDQMTWPGTIERALAVINEAPFLSDEQTRDILYNNAARFFRLTEEEIERHHGM